MRHVEVKTQAELDALPGDAIAVVRSGYWRASGSTTVWAFDSATVEAFESSTVRASDHSTVRASDATTVWAFGSSTVWASGSSTVRAFNHSTVRASGRVAVHRSPHHDGTIVGGGIIDALDPRTCTATEWLEDKGIQVKNGTAVLYKAVHDDWQTGRKGGKWVYEPGRTVVAEDYNTDRVCGGGLHLCATPWHSRGYLSDASRFVAVEVLLDEVTVVDFDKVKVRSCRVLHAVDLDGERVSS